MQAVIAGLVAAFVGLLLLGPCTSTGPPDVRGVERQIQLINMSLDAIHEQVAAARRPPVFELVVFVVSLVFPLMGAMWILFRAERSAVGHDQIVRQLIRLGADELVVRHYMEHVKRPALPSTDADKPVDCIRPRPREPTPQRERGWPRK